MILCIISAVLLASGCVVGDGQPPIENKEITNGTESNHTQSQPTESVTVQNVTTQINDNYLMIERQAIFTKLKKDIASLLASNEELSEKKRVLQESCGAKLKQLQEEYDSIEESLRQETAEIDEWKTRLDSAMETSELLVKAVRETTGFIGLLELKKTVLANVVGYLHALEGHYPACLNYVELYNIGWPEVEGFESGAIAARSSYPVDHAEAAFNMELVKLEINLEAVRNENVNLKNTIEFLESLCHRREQSLKKRIEILRTYPADIDCLKIIKTQVTEVEAEIALNKGWLSSATETLAQLANEVLELQYHYEYYSEMQDCFLGLARYSIEGVYATLTKTIFEVGQLQEYLLAAAAIESGVD